MSGNNRTNEEEGKEAKGNKGQILDCRRVLGTRQVHLDVPR